MPFQGRHITITGTVQGVGLRPWVFRLAKARSLVGWVRNDSSGVTIEAFGPGPALTLFEYELRETPPPAAVIRTFTARIIEPQSHNAFVIVPSAPSDERRVSIPPDLATCDACLREVRNPADRRYRYPFTNCTNCGPRFTIARSVPYDRPHTTMAAFVMCPLCQAEYEDPGNRRFHAQPNACPVCGPRVWLCDAPGHPSASGPLAVESVAADPIARLAKALRSGQLAAVKGLGGFHFACDATNTEAVAELRRRKRRDEKPFAVMVATLADAEQLAHLTDDERRLLTSVERPIVIVNRRPDAILAPNVSPDNPTVGLLLPYSPLHHVLLADAARPLVMTSGNVSDEPIVYRNDEALTQLGAFADLFLLHDRDIDTRCDDSVMRIIAGRPVTFRRSRGYTPRAVAVPSLFVRPVLACGALLKNTFCLGVGDSAYLGPHIGDLENLETFESFEHAVGRMTRFVGMDPEVVAHDLHPEYVSTGYAQQHPAPIKIAVQHHHAHVASAMAEHGLEGPVLGVAYDGTGFGTDGTAWGGEILLAEYARYTRLATMRPIPLAGGDIAIRQVWRQALAVLSDAFDGAPPLGTIPLFAAVPAGDLVVVQQMLAGGVNTSLVRGVGRYFDAAGALGLCRQQSRHEGQIALAWNLVADPAETSEYPFGFYEDDGLTTMDVRAAFRALADDLRTGRTPATISARFQNTLARMTVEVVETLLRRLGRMPVVLSGGCFQNARLTESIVRHLGSAVQVVLHHSVPPGDGGLALGQAVVANALVQAGGH
jgi:hydrogenase maturation protein HypF